MKKNFNWRLSKLPTPEEVTNLVNHKIITQEEARAILFSEETAEDRDKKSLESEIEFLRKLVDKLSNNSRIVETIREIKTPYYTSPWWKSYDAWCGSIPATSGTVTYNAGNSSITGSAMGSTNAMAQLSTIGKNFSEIKTF